MVPVWWWSPLFRPGAGPPTAVACGTIAAMAVLPGDVRKRLGWPLLLPGLASLTSTAIVLATGTGTHAPATGTTLEVVALLLLLIHVTRWGTGWSLVVVTGVTAAAHILWLLRYMPGDPWSRQFASCAFWALGAAVAIVFGAYPRWAAARLQRTVASARRAQQRQLERDLHDYVAHDLSGMIVQAQAARYAAAGDPEALATALRRIEDAGRRAMSSMDRSLSLLRVDTEDRAPATRLPGLEELPTLVAHFDRDSAAEVELGVAGDVATVPGEVGEVLYRACTEALTNVRRHATIATTSYVRVRVRVGDGWATLTVTNSGPVPPPPAPSPREGGGTGLARLRERVEALEGRLDAGPTREGWTLEVCIPFATAGRRDEVPHPRSGAVSQTSDVAQPHHGGDGS